MESSHRHRSKFFDDYDKLLREHKAMQEKRYAVIPVKRKRSRSDSPCSCDCNDREIKAVHTEPDRSMGDLYCKSCDSHMNSEQMWESHVQGKRHLKNAEKSPDEKPSKVKLIDPDRKQEAYAQEQLERIDGPIVGLSHITEIRKNDPLLWPTYQCYLCSGHLASLFALREHLATAKHQMAYLKFRDPNAHTSIEQMQLSKYDLETVLKTELVELEDKYGRGVMTVKYEKSKNYPEDEKSESEWSYRKRKSYRRYEKFHSEREYKKLKRYSHEKSEGEIEYENRRSLAVKMENSMTEREKETARHENKLLIRRFLQPHLDVKVPSPPPPRRKVYQYNQSHSSFRARSREDEIPTLRREVYRHNHSSFRAIGMGREDGIPNPGREVYRHNQSPFRAIGMEDEIPTSGRGVYRHSQSSFRAMGMENEIPSPGREVYRHSKSSFRAVGREDEIPTPRQGMYQHNNQSSFRAIDKEDEILPPGRGMNQYNNQYSFRAIAKEDEIDIFSRKFLMMDIKTLMDIMKIKLQSMEKNGERNLLSIASLHRMSEHFLMLHKMKNLTPKEQRNLNTYLRQNRLEFVEMLLRQDLPRADIKNVLSAYFDIERKKY